MKPVDLSGELFAQGIILLALEQFREHGRTAVPFTHGNDPGVVYEIRIKSVNGVRMTARDGKELQRQAQRKYALAR
jgi:hypothetical protein